MGGDRRTFSTDGHRNAPVVHFGLGPVTKVNRVEVRWTDGTRTVLNGEFLANRRYTIERKREES